MTAGTLLYRALSQFSALILLSDVPAEDWMGTAELNGWLLENNFTSHADIMPGGTTRVAQVNKLRARGYSLEFIIDPDPINSGNLIREGYSVLNFVHAQYAVPSWRPDFEASIRPWDDLAAGIAEQARMKAQDEKNRLRTPE